MRQAWTATLALALACSQAETRPAPAPIAKVSGPENLLLISIDTLRADHVGAYGYLRPTTPNLDRLASQGVVFEATWSQSPWTLPSHASLLTGLYTRGHGLRDDGHRLSPDVPVIFELLRDAGYRTGAVVNTVHLLGRTNLVRGVEHFEYLHSHDGNGDRVLSLEAGVSAAIDFLEVDDPRPFFLLLHSYDVHSDYLPGEAQRELLVRPYDGPLDGSTETLRRIRRGLVQPGPDDVRHLVDLYDAAIRQMDDRLGPLLHYLDARGLAHNTLVVVTSDHGEEFYERGSVLHGRTVYEEMLRVPLIVRGPGVSPARAGRGPGGPRGRGADAAARGRLAAAPRARRPRPGRPLGEPPQPAARPGLRRGRRPEARPQPRPEPHRGAPAETSS